MFDHDEQDKSMIKINVDRRIYKVLSMLYSTVMSELFVDHRNDQFLKLLDQSHSKDLNEKKKKVLTIRECTVCIDSACMS